MVWLPQPPHCPRGTCNVTPRHTMSHTRHSATPVRVTVCLACHISVTRAKRCHTGPHSIPRPQARHACTTCHTVPACAAGWASPMSSFPHPLSFTWTQGWPRSGSMIARCTPASRSSTSSCATATAGWPRAQAGVPSSRRPVVQCTRMGCPATGKAKLWWTKN